jgi:serine/threonine protein kinase/tetratricopeptide (TPR) repeat protein
MLQDAEHWEQLQALFHLAEETPDEELDALLLVACPDAELRQRAAALIRASRKEPEPGVPVDNPGRRIGSYIVLRHLGSGGIGTVYLVERTTAGVVQKAALKVLTRSAAGPFFVERFAREQQILASLDHPNITRLLDAGVSEEGEPYLTMEYVDGVHLDVYCDDRALGIAERLQLFLRVCEAVAYAHRSLVVHLDLKPSNILVSEAGGIVKLLDFGTSKLIQPDSLLTTTVMATPAYASPEQLRNEPVTTVCDVYALGAILFELLSGRRPNQDSSVAVMIERSMKELPPESVTEAVTAAAAEHRGLTETRLRSVLTGDLATIVAKCITPRPKDRYATVEALIVDVQRYLAGRPILARPQTTTYRLGKFVRRNRTLVGTASVLLFCLLGVSGYAAWRQEQAYREGQRALQMQTFMDSLFRLANSKYTGRPVATIPEYLRLGVTVLPTFIQDSQDRRIAQLSLAESMYLNGDTKDALPVFYEVIASARAVRDTNSVVEAESYAGDITNDQGDTVSSRQLTADALALSDRSEVTPMARVWAKVYYASNREDSGTRSDENLSLLRSAVAESEKRLPERQSALVLAKLAGYLEQRGRLKEAAPVLQQAIAIFKTEPYAVCDEAESDGDLAYVKGATGDAQGSVYLFERAYLDLKSCSGPDTRPTLMMQAHLASAMLKNHRASAVVPMLEASMPAWRRLSGDSPDLSNPLIFLARAYLANGDFAKAETTAAETVRVQSGKVDAKTYRMGVSQLVWAQALAAEGRPQEALVHSEQAVLGLSVNPALTAGQKQTNADAAALLSKLQVSLSARQ